MQFNEITLFLLIFVGFFVIAVGYIGVLEGIQKLKKQFSYKKDALKIIGKDAIKSGDKGAKLAYKGIVKFLNEKYEGAAAYFEKALKLNIGEDNSAFCYKWLAACYEKRGKWEACKAVYRRAAETLATSDGALVSYANCCARNSDFKNAEHYYNRALNYNPNNVNAYIGLGLIAETRAEYEKAVGYFDTAQKISEDCLTAMYEKAVCYAAMGIFSETEKLMLQATAIDENDNYSNYKTKIRNIIKISEHDLLKEEGSEIS